MYSSRSSSCVRWGARPPGLPPTAAAPRAPGAGLLVGVPRVVARPAAPLAACIGRTPTAGRSLATGRTRLARAAVPQRQRRAWPQSHSATLPTVGKWYGRAVSGRDTCRCDGGGAAGMDTGGGGACADGGGGCASPAAASLTDPASCLSSPCQRLPGSALPSQSSDGLPPASADAACATCLLPLHSPSIVDEVGAAEARAVSAMAASGCNLVYTMPCCGAHCHLACVVRAVALRGVRKTCCACHTPMTEGEQAGVLRLHTACHATATELTARILATVEAGGASVRSTAPRLGGAAGTQHSRSLPDAPHRASGALLLTPPGSPLPGARGDCDPPKTAAILRAELATAGCAGGAAGGSGGGGR